MNTSLSWVPGSNVSFFEFECLLKPREMYPLNKDMIDFHLMKTASMPFLLLSMPGQLQDMLLLEVPRNLRSGINFLGFTDIQAVIFKELIPFINFTFVTRK